MTKTENNMKSLATKKIKAIAKKRAYELDKEGKFDEHFTLTVFRDLMSDSVTRAEYEIAIEGDAYQNGFHSKGILNMHIAEIIQFAIGAKTKRDMNGNRYGISVQNEPIQSYSLLTKS